MIDFNWQRDYRGNLEWLQQRTVLLVRHGSHAYGLATETSDLDIKGVAIPPSEYFLGFLKRFEQAESKEPDMSIYDIRKFFQLACDCNPNIIEVLWVDGEDVIQENWVGAALRHYRASFLSKKARHTFSGYAHAQLKRIKTHKKWLLNPLTRKPERGEFGLPETTILSADIMGAVKALAENRLHNVAWFDNEVRQFSPEIMHAYQRERAYHNALREWSQYQTWKTNRNPARAEIEAKFGYDTKHAMHLVRLMRMCREILTESRVVVKRPDHEELLAIRSGAWKYEALVEWAEAQDIEMAALAEKSTLSHTPDRVYLDNLCEAWVGEFLRERSGG